MSTNKRDWLGSATCRLWIRAFLVASAAALPVNAQAQEMPRLTAELGLGIAHAAGGPPTESRGLLLLSLQPAVSVLRSGASAVLVAADRSMHGGPRIGAACSPDVATPCTRHPGASAWSLLLGWGRTTQSAHALRVLVGPARVGIDRHVGAGGLARVDWSLPSSPRGDWVIFGQTLVTPAWRGHRNTTISTGIGIRLGSHYREPRTRRRQPKWRWPT